MRIEISIIFSGAELTPRAVELLEGIAQFGHLNEACRHIGMHQRLAKELLEKLRIGVGRPLVEVRVGGRERGATLLTEFGAKVVYGFRLIEKEISIATQTEVIALQTEGQPLDLPPFKKWRTAARSRPT